VASWLYPKEDELEVDGSGSWTSMHRSGSRKGQVGRASMGPVGTRSSYRCAISIMHRDDEIVRPTQGKLSPTVLLWRLKRIAVAG